MIDFKEPILSDKEWVTPLMRASGFKGDEYCFGNIFTWRKVYNCKIARLNDYFIARSGDDEKASYVFPAGTGDILPVIRTLMEDAKERGCSFRMHGINQESMALLETLFPDTFVFTPDRDSFDYIYTWDKLAYLKGKKLHGKRNHIARFEERENWQYEKITVDNIHDCELMNEQWCKLNGCGQSEDLQKEACAVRSALRHFFELDLIGGLIRLEGEVIAFSIGEPINNDTIDVHVEKAFYNIQGAYPIINREFVRNSCVEFTYINREEDMGDEGLRKAKLSYQPDILYEKYSATLKGENVQ